MSTTSAKFSGRSIRWGLLIAFIAISYVWARALSLLEYIFLAPVLSAATLATAFAVWATVESESERKAVGRARQGLLPLDGEWGAAIGPIVPLSEEMPEAPFSGRKAVACTYRIYKKERRNMSRGSHIDYEVAACVGRVITPSEVRTAAGPVRVVGMPLLEVDKEILSGWESLGRAREYLSRTTFQDREHVVGQGGTDVVLSSKELDPEAPGLREDFRYSQVTDLRDWLLEETIVPPGLEVSVFGWYSASLGALVCPPEGSAKAAGVKMLLLRPGGVEAAEAAERRHAGCARFFGALALVVQLAAIAAFYGR
jgi:hypothetical protein